MAADIRKSGALAAVGSAESKSLEIAINQAKTDGRIRLADRLKIKVESIRNNFSEETGLSGKDPLLGPFDTLAQTITTDHIQRLVAKELKYETTNNLVSAYALMELAPQVILDRLAKEKELDTRFRATKAFENLDAEIKKYEAYKKAQVDDLMAQ